MTEANEMYKDYLMSVVNGDNTETTKTLFNEDGKPIDVYAPLYDLDLETKNSILEELRSINSMIELEKFAVRIDAMIKRNEKLNELGI
jgi:hypothetical protein